MALDKDLLAFGERLRALRVDVGFTTGKDFAERLGWVPPKVSRIENGRQMPADADIVTWLDAVSAPEAVAEEIRAALRDLKLVRASWKRRLRTGHASLQRSAYELERNAARIALVELFVVPGLVQTPDYARAVFTAAAALHQTPNDTEDAVRERMRRQEVLYDANKRIEIMVGEFALRHPVCSPQVMRAQLDRLVGLIGLDNVRLGVLPANAGLSIVPMHGFWIIDDRVLVEIHHTEVTADAPDDVALYHRITEALWAAAVEGNDARALLTRIAAELAG